MPHDAVKPIMQNEKYMYKYIWVMNQNEILYNLEVIKYFSPHELLLGTSNAHNKDLIQGYSAGDYTWRTLSFDDIAQFPNIIANTSQFIPGSCLEGKTFPHSRCIQMLHATDSYISSHAAPRYYIFSSQRQAECQERHKISRAADRTLFERISHLPEALRDEFAYTGPYHIGGWAQKRHTPKPILQQELAGSLGVSFDPHKPVVAFLMDEFCHPSLMQAGLARLATQVNLVVKMNGSVPGAFNYTIRGLAPNLLRFAADYILAGYNSGTLASSTMLGLKVIPYYTALIYYGGRRKGKLARHTAYLDNPKHSRICYDILNLLNPPVDLQDTATLLARMKDNSWWEGYAARLPEAQRAIFGGYTIDDAAEKTARLIRRVFATGTFGEDTAAVRLRSDAGQ